MKSDIIKGGGPERGIVLSFERRKKVLMLVAAGGAILLGGCGIPGSDSDSSDRPPEATEQPKNPDSGKDKKAKKRAQAEAKRKARAKAAKEAKARKQAQAEAQRAAQAAQTATTTAPEPPQSTEQPELPAPPQPKLIERITPTDFVYNGLVLPSEIECESEPNSIVGCTTQTPEDIQQFGAAYAGIIDRTFDELNSALPDEVKPVEARFVVVHQGAKSKECPGFGVGNQRYCLKKDTVGIGTDTMRLVYKQSARGDEALAVRAAKTGVSMFLRAQRISSSREFNYCLAGSVTASLLHQEDSEPKTAKEKARAAEKEHRVMNTIEEIAQSQVDKSGKDNEIGAKEAWVGAFVDAYTERAPYVTCATHDPETASQLLRGA